MKDEVGFQPSDTFDVLRERTRSLRAKRDRVEWSSISLEMRGGPVKNTRSYGVARIDKSLFRNLGGGEPTSFRVEPGEHTVTVQLSRWVRLSRFRGSSKLRIQVSAVAGEEVKLVCGLRPGAREEWRLLRMARIRPVVIFCAGGVLAVLMGGLLFSFIGWLLAPAAIFVVIRGVTIPPPAISLVLRAVVIAPIIVPWYLLCDRLILAPNRRVLQSLTYRFAYPYFLKKAEESLDARQPAV
jgi:hypothetical protein